MNSKTPISPTIALHLCFDDPLALLEEDSSGEGARRILLIVDWEARQLYAETWDSTGETVSEYRRYNRETAYALPPLVDAGELHEWAEAELLPLARPLFAAYERQWDGDRWIGAFPGAEFEKREFDAWMAHEAEPLLLQGENAGLWPVEEWLVDAPEGLRADTPDADLLPLAEEIEAEARRDRIVLAGNVAQYLEEMREEMREALPGARRAVLEEERAALMTRLAEIDEEIEEIIIPACL